MLVRPKPPVKDHEPPKLPWLVSSTSTCLRRPPNLIACVPLCLAVKLFNSQLLRTLKEWPTCEPPALNEPLTSNDGTELLPICSFLPRENWKRVSLTVVGFRIAVSVT